MNDLPAIIQSLGGWLPGVAALVTAVGIFVQNWRNGKKADDAKVAAEVARLAAETSAVNAKVAAEKSDAVLVQTKKGIFRVGESVDGRVSEFLKAKEAEYEARVKQAYLEGVAAGEQAQRDRASGPQP